MPTPNRRLFLSRLPSGEGRFISEALRQETVGGALLLIAAIAGLVAANTALSGAYENLSNYVIGPPSLNLDLSLKTWAADGLLAIFFFVAGLELKRELVVGTLSQPAQAVLPVVAAIAGIAVPAVLFFIITTADPAARSGWAIPTATDIAFALAVLAVVASHTPPALRAFLLTLAVVDDLVAITIIAVFFTSDLELAPLLCAGLLLIAYAFLQRARVTTRLIYIPLALLVWALVHESGVHATVAGVALGLLTRVRPDEDEEASPAERLEHRIRPLSAGVAVPIFAFFAAGVSVSLAQLGSRLNEPLFIAIVVGLVAGKTIGIFSGTWLTARFTKAELDPSLKWVDILGLSMAAGVGFTVSFLIAELAFELDPSRLDAAKAAVFAGSLLATLLASVVLRGRDRAYRQEELYRSDSNPESASDPD